MLSGIENITKHKENIDYVSDIEKYKSKLGSKSKIKTWFLHFLFIMDSIIFHFLLVLQNGNLSL